MIEKSVTGYILLNLPHFRITFSGFVFLFCLFLVGVSAASGLSDAELKRINEAAALIRSHALIVPKSTKRMTNDIIRSYSHSIDDYGDFLTASEYAAFLESSNSDYFGVEMDIEKRHEHIYLYPFKGGRAEKSGIQAGDELMAVNGAPVYGKSVFLVGSTIRGVEGEPVQLTVRSGKGIPRLFTLRRENTNYASVRFQSFDSVYYVQITRFVQNTAVLLKGFLKRDAGESKILVVDLRQNQGGSLRVARQCADFFLESGTVLFHLQTRDSIRDILAETPVMVAGRVILIQDKNTASAAEVFIAALVENGRAVAAGEKSFGKGLAQRFLPLSDGGALRLTYAEILTPENNAYNGKGLLPTIPLSEEFLNRDFSRKQVILDFLKVVDKKQSN